MAIHTLYEQLLCFIDTKNVQYDYPANPQVLNIFAKESKQHISIEEEARLIVRHGATACALINFSSDDIVVLKTILTASDGEQHPACEEFSDDTARMVRVTVEDDCKTIQFRAKEIDAISSLLRKSGKTSLCAKLVYGLMQQDALYPIYIAQLIGHLQSYTWCLELFSIMNTTNRKATIQYLHAFGFLPWIISQLEPKEERNTNVNGQLGALNHEEATVLKQTLKALIWLYTEENGMDDNGLYYEPHEVMNFPGWEYNQNDGAISQTAQELHRMNKRQRAPDTVTARNALEDSPLSKASPHTLPKRLSFLPYKHIFGNGTLFGSSLKKTSLAIEETYPSCSLSCNTGSEVD